MASKEVRKAAEEVVGELEHWLDPDRGSEYDMRKPPDPVAALERFARVAVENVLADIVKENDRR